MLRAPPNMKIKTTLAVLALGLAAVSIPLSHACTRVVYLGPEGMVITARGVDWQVTSAQSLELPEGHGPRRGRRP